MAGISQVGATIFIEDDTSPDADSDGDNDTYSAVDIVNKGLASGDAIDLGTNTKAIRFRANVQNGDGAGSSVTTFKGLNHRILFDATRTYIVSVTGQSNRWTRFGTKVIGSSGKPSGRQGVNLELGAAATFRGNFLIYGSLIRNAAAGAINMVPGSAGRTTEIINSIFETTSGVGNVALGTNAGNIQLIYNLDVILGGTGVISNFQADFAERLTVAVTGSNPYFFNTASSVQVKDLVLIGTPTVADLQLTGTTCDFINTTWSGNAPKFIVASDLREWSGFDVMAINPITGLQTAGIPITVYDRYGVVVMSGTTDADGRVPFGTVGTIYENALVVAKTLSNVTTEQGPFRMVVGGVPGLYAGFEYYFEWASRDLPSGYGKQYSPMLEIIPLKPLSPNNWGELLTDTVY